MANPQIHAMLSEAVRRQAGRLAEAAPIYQKVLALEPNNPDALYLLGVAALQNGQPKPAAELIRRAIAVNSRQPDYHFHLAMALTNSGEADEAIASYRRDLVLRQGDAGTLNNLGNVLAASGKYDEALTCLRRALEAEPGNWGAVNNLGTVLLWSLDRKDEAENHYRKALALKPDYADAMVNLGNAMRDKGDVTEAAECFRRALALEPGSAAAHNNLGQALWNLGKRDEAMACYRKAVALDPNLLAAQANLGIALWESGELDEADKIYRHILKTQASDPDLLNNFAALSMARGDAGAALEAISRSMQIKETRRAKKLFVELAGNAGWGATNTEFRAAAMHQGPHRTLGQARQAQPCGCEPGQTQSHHRAFGRTGEQGLVGAPFISGFAGRCRLRAPGRGCAAIGASDVDAQHRHGAGTLSHHGAGGHAGSSAGRNRLCVAWRSNASSMNMSFCPRRRKSRRRTGCAEN